MNGGAGLYKATTPMVWTLFENTLARCLANYRTLEVDVPCRASQNAKGISE